MRIPFTDLVITRNVPIQKGKTTSNGDNVLGLLGAQGIRIAPKDLWQIYRMNADVYSCIRELKQGVGDGGYVFVNPKDEEVEADPATVAFLVRFYKNSGGFTRIKKQAIRDAQISGAAFFEIIKDVTGSIFGLKRLDPRCMYIIADVYGTILAYVQRVHGSSDVIFEPNSIWHYRPDDDPNNVLLGMSPLETALWEARTDISAAQSNYAFFENDAVPSNLYILEKGFTIEEKREAVKAINEQFSGSANRHKSAILDGVKEVKTLSMSQKDMEFVIGRKFNTDKICSVYGVPKYILGYTESVNYSNGEGVLRKFYQSTLQPMEDDYRDAKMELYNQIGIGDKVKLKFLPQTFIDEAQNRTFSLEEFKSGASTLRQYKVKTGQKVTAEDESELMIDKHIIQNGASAVLLDDVGVDPVIDPNDQATANNIVQALETKLLYDEKNA